MYHNFCDIPSISLAICVTAESLSVSIIAEISSSDVKGETCGGVMSEFRDVADELLSESELEKLSLLNNVGALVSEYSSVSYKHVLW